MQSLNPHKARVIPLTKLISGPRGFIPPLCNSCQTKDCGNPIENTKVSILGVNKDMRVWKDKSTTGLVISCEGYST